MSKSGSLSDEGSPSSSSRFEHAMSGSSWPLLESGTKETLDDPHNCQTLANIGSSSMLVGEGVVCDAIPVFRSDPHNCQTLANIGSSSMLVGEGVVCDAIPIFRSELTADHLENNLLDRENQLEALRQSCSIPRSVGIRLVHCEELPSEPPKGHVMFYTQTLVTLGVNLPLHLWLERMLSFIGYASGQLNPGFWNTLIGFYIIWMECGLGEPSFHQWHYCYKMRPVKACTGYAECACRSERERVVFDKRKAYCIWKKRWCFLYNDWEHAKGVTPERRVPTHFQTVAASKKAEAEAIGCAAGIVAGEDRRLLLSLPTINPIFPPVREHIGQEGRRFTFDELGEPLAKDELDCDRMLKLSSYVMAEYHDRLIPTEKEAAVKEFLGSQAFLHVLRPRCTREVHFEKRKWMAVLDRYDDGSVLRKYREEIDEHHRKGETFNLPVYYSSAYESGDEASADEQSHQGDDEFGDVENGGRTQSDMIRGSTSDEDDKNIPWMAKGLVVRASELVGARAADADDLEQSVPVRTECSFTRDSITDSGLGMLLAQAQPGQLLLYQKQVRMEFLLWKSDMKCEHPELLVVEMLPIVRDYRIGNAEYA
ncbi:unnamed protein product [Malus baccata var. baccata]